MIKNRFNSEIAADITEIVEDDRAEITAANGLSTFTKFMLVALPKHENEYSKIIFNGLNADEKEQLFDMLDKELHEETYLQLEEKATKFEFENEDLKSEVKQYQEHLSDMRRR